MATIKFKPEADVARFFVHQPTDIRLSSTVEIIQDEKREQIMNDMKLKIRKNPFSFNDSDESEEEPAEDLRVLQYVSYDNI